MNAGRRVGLRRIAEEGETASKGLSATEGAIFGLLGLILAFLFSEALTRFDAARHLVVEEANHIGTAWLRIALLPADAQPSMRDLFRRYLDSRIEIYRRVPNIPDMEAIRQITGGFSIRCPASPARMNRNPSIPAPLLRVVAVHFLRRHLSRAFRLPN